MTMNGIRRGLALVALVAGCAQDARPPRSAGTPQASAPPPMLLPATFVGTLPCASCAGIRTTVSLFSDGTFRLRSVYDGRPEGALTTAAFGTWRALDGARRLVLDGGPDGVRQFGRVGQDSLRLLDNTGADMVSPLPYVLGRQAAVDTVRDAMRLRGTINETAEAVRFTECGSGVSFLLTTRGAFEALGRDVRKAQRTPRQAASVVLRGRLLARPPGMTGRGELLEVDTVERVWPGGSCGAGAPR
jgi:copper homeostasis protein (lipoprotein)